MKTTNPLNPFLEQNGTMILDGGLATELEQRGHDLDHTLWSARLLIDDPQSIFDVHLDYLKAGADCIVSASYQASILGFIEAGINQIQAEKLLLKSAALALNARNEYWSKMVNRAGRIRPLVAASIGPYGAALADGSEYSGDYDLNEEGLFWFHRRRWQILASSEVDLMACETIPSFAETKVLLKIIRETPDKYVWMSFSCRDGRCISDGTPIALCAAEAQKLPQVAALGINCTAPRFIPDLIAEIKKETDKPILVYPNSGEQYDGQTKKWTGQASPVNFAKSSKEWRRLGAQIVGGCCRTYPEHISQIRRSLLPGQISKPSPQSKPKSGGKYG